MKSLVILGIAMLCAGLAAAATPAPAAPAAPATAEAPGFYAIYLWPIDLPRYIDDIRGVGFTWARAGGWKCGDPRTEAGLTVAARKGLNLVPVLQLANMGHGKTMPADEAVEGIARLAADNVRRYGPGGSFWTEHPELPEMPVRCWEIWNEPNIEFLTPPEGLLRTELYARLLTAASGEIRRLDPGATIIAFNSAGGGPDRGQALKADGMFQKLKYIGWRKFIRDVAAAVDPKVYDAIGTHPYTQPRSPDGGGVLDGLDMIAELGLDKPIWFTEVGFPLDYPRGRQVRDAAQQAAYLVRLFAVAGAHGVVQVQVMYLVDIVYGPDKSKRTFGLFTAPGEWREQALATQVMMRLVPDPRRERRILSQRQGGLFAYRFTGPDGAEVIMAWNSSNERDQAEFPAAAGDYCQVDMLGKVSPIEAQDGVLRVSIGEAPVYVVARSADEVAGWLKTQ